MEKEDSTSYKQIAKSTGIFGGSQFLIILTGIVRTKVLAVLLGTAGVGLVGLYQSIIDLVRSVTGLGLSFSSVKDIAEAKRTEDNHEIARTVTTLHRWVWWTGVSGMFLMIVFAAPLSEYTFGDKSKVWPICLLSFCVLMGALSSGQIALLQGLRQISKMARASVYGAVGGLIVAVVMYSILGIDGIVPALIAISILSLLFSWWFARTVKTEKIALTIKETLLRGRGMVKLGLYTVFSGLVSTLTLFLMKSFIVHTDGVNTVGLFQSVWSVSSVYLGAILTSMGVDYFPRLCGLKDENRQIVRLSNEQTRFVLFVSTPIIVGMLLVAVPVLRVLYSSNFILAANLLRWQIFGTFFKVLIWPVGFILLSKGKGLRFFIVEFTWSFVYYIATRFCWPYFGLNSAGVSFVIAYLVYLPLVYFMVKPLCDFKYETHNLLLILLFFLSAVAAFLASVYLNGWFSYICGGVIFALCALLSGFELNKVLPAHLWISKLKNLFNKRSE